MPIKKISLISKKHWIFSQILRSIFSALIHNLHWMMSISKMKTKLASNRMHQILLFKVWMKLHLDSDFAKFWLIKAKLIKNRIWSHKDGLLMIFVLGSLRKICIVPKFLIALRKKIVSLISMIPFSKEKKRTMKSKFFILLPKRQ